MIKTRNGIAVAGFFSVFLKDPSHLLLSLVTAKLVSGVRLAKQVVWNVVVVFFKNGYLSVFDERISVDPVSLNAVEKMRDEIEICDLFHLEGDVIATLKLDPAYVVVLGISLDKLAQSSE